MCVVVISRQTAMDSGVCAGFGLGPNQAFFLFTDEAFERLLQEIGRSEEDMLTDPAHMCGILQYATVVPCASARPWLCCEEPACGALTTRCAPPHHQVCSR